MGRQSTRKNSVASAASAAPTTAVIPVESEEQSGTAREAHSTVVEREPVAPVVVAAASDVGIQSAAHMTEGAEMSSAPASTSVTDPAPPMVLTAGMGVEALPVALLGEGADNTELKIALAIEGVDLSDLGSTVISIEDLNKRADGFVADLPHDERIALTEALTRFPASTPTLDRGPTHLFEACSNILHNGVDTGSGEDIELDRDSFEKLKAVGAVAGNWPDD